MENEKTSKISKKTFLVTCIVALLPMVVGLLLWNQLPEEIATHFGADGVADGWSSKGTAVFGLPLFLLFVHVLCVGITLQDPKRANMNEKMLALILWICPLVSVFMTVAVYGNAMGYDMNVEKLAMVLVSLLFVIIGNYLPKCKPNYTVGIKLPWTLDSEENWNRTHRLAGFVWVIGGLVMLVNAFVGADWLMLAVMLVLVLVPTGYSFLYYLRHGKDAKE